MPGAPGQTSLRKFSSTPPKTQHHRGGGGGGPPHPRRLSPFAALPTDPSPPHLRSRVPQPHGHFCNPDIGGCANRWIVYGYFISFVLLVQFIFVNVFIAVIVENFEQLSQFLSPKITNDHLTMFLEGWLALDENGDGCIAANCLSTLLYKIGPPLGLNWDDHQVWG